MYCPYFRGKQNELITIRENAELLKQSGFVPIIEPVKESLAGLIKALSAIVEEDGRAVVILNPYHGDHSDDGKSILSLIQGEFGDNLNILPGILLLEDLTLEDAQEFYSSFNGKEKAFIHAGFSEAKQLAASFNENISDILHVFREESCGKLYQRHFEGAQRVLLRDGFQKRPNREYPPIEFFSELHATFNSEGMQGFSDYLIVGDDYSESGGPAYAVVIHLTFIDPNKDEEMHIHHFKSDRQDDAKDPAGKFSEALNKLVEEVNRPGSNILRTAAVEEFFSLHERGHFPGLGYVKKLSMQHHIETLANYFESN